MRRNLKIVFSQYILLIIEMILDDFFIFLMVIEMVVQCEDLYQHLVLMSLCVMFSRDDSIIMLKDEKDYGRWMRLLGIILN
jgi:hypothetical protein